MRLTLRQIDAFLAVAQRGSFTSAARQLGVSQSAVSMLISELEQTLRVKLLNRTTRRVDLTEAGRRFQARTSQLFSDVGAAVKELHALADRKSGKVTVASGPFLASTLLPRAIAEVRRRYPGIEVALLDAGQEQFAASVHAGDADIGVGTFPADLQDLRRTVVAKSELHVFCTDFHPLLQEQQVSWKMLEAMPIIALPKGAGIRYLCDQAARTAGFVLRPAYEVHQSSTCLALVEQGLGVTVFPAYTAGLNRFSNIHSRPLSKPTVSHELQIISRREHVLSPAAAAFADVLVRELKKASLR